MKTCHCNKQEIFLALKIVIFSLKMIFFPIFAQNMDCGYTLEPPRRGGSNEYPQSMFEYPQSMFWNKYTLHTPVLLYIYIKVGFKGVYITWTWFRDVTKK